LRKAIAATIPGFEKMSEMDETGEEFQISGRTLHQAHFTTPDHKANFSICPIPSLNGKEGEFRMMTVRSEGQFNSIVYENDLITLESSAGKMERVKVRTFDIPPGNIITYYPESNVLVSTTTDPRSLTPGFKLTWVKILRPN